MYYKKENNRVNYFQGIMPFFHHAEEDLQSFRLAVSLLAETCNVKQIRISQVFGIIYIFVKRCVKISRKQGPKGFFQDIKGRSPHILTEKVVNKAQKLLENGLLKYIEKYFRLPEGYYGIETILYPIQILW